MVILFILGVLKPQSDQNIAGLSNVGQGETLVLGEMGDAPVNPDQSSQGDP